MPLTEIQARNSKPRERAYKMADGEGLFLFVQPNGSKLWRMKYRFAGKEKLLSFGAYPDLGIGGMGYPGAGASCFCLSQREPGAEGNDDADKDMLAEDPPGEGDNHPGELVDGPETDELRIVEPTRDDVWVCHGDAPSRPMRQMTAVTTEVTIGTPVPTPMPTPTGTAT